MIKSSRINNFLLNSFITTAILVFMSDWLQKINIFHFPSGFRHVIIFLIFSINSLVFIRKFYIPKKYLKRLILMLIFIICAFFNSTASLFNYILGAFFTFLFVSTFIFSLNIRTTRLTITIIIKSLIAMLFIMSIGPVCEGVITGETLRWLPGAFREVGALGTAMNIGCILCLSLYIHKPKKFYIYLAFFFSFGVLLTILKKTMVSNFVVWILFYKINLRYSISKIKFISILVILIPVGSFFVASEIQENLDLNRVYLENAGPEKHVRLGMYIASFNIMKDNFPYGSGLGTFGSLSSITKGYSNTHIKYNVSEIGNNSPEDVAKGHHTLLDTFWPHIFGELGILGSIIFISIFIYPVLLPIKIIKNTNDSFIKSLSFLIILVVTTVIWEGLSLYTPEVPAFIFIHSGLIGLCYYHIYSHKQFIKSIKT
jgi:hypothetical protein